MGLFDWLLGHGDEEQGWTREQPPPIPSKVGFGPDLDKGRHKTQTEKDLRRVEGQYDPETDRFAPEKESPAKYD